MRTRAKVQGAQGLAIVAAACLLALGLAGCTSGGSGQPPACTAGSEGCACKAGNACDGDLQCADGLCATATCVAGTMGCACRTGGACDAGLECSGETCQAPVGTGLVVGNAAVRACDVVLAAAGATASFGQTVTGVSARRVDRLALSFIAKADAPLEGPVAAVTGSDGAALSGLAPEKVECFDRLGQAVADPAVTFR